MPTIDLGRVKGDTGVSMRSKGTWTPSTAYVNNSQYIDVVTNGGNSYSCKTSHTSGTTFSSENWNLVAQKGAKGDKGDTGNTPTIKAGTATSLESNASPTVSATTSGDITTFNFGIPKGDTSKFETPTFTDTVSTYTTLSAANTAAETASNAIKSKVSIFTTLSNMKKSFSAIVQGLKILATNVGAINGITSDINSESTSIAASSKMVHDLNSNLTPVQIGLDFISGMTTDYGVLVDSLSVKQGKMIQFQFGITFSRNVPVNNTVTLSGLKYPPINTLFITSRGFSIEMYLNGKVNIQNISALPWSSGETKYFNGVYMTNI